MEEANDTKERILALLLRTPGLSTAAVARELDLDPTTADHHLRRLRRSGRTASAPVGRELCWFATRSQFCPMLQRAIPILRRPVLARVARELEEFAQTAPSISARSGVEVGQVRWATTALVGCGLAERTRGGLVQLAPGTRVCVEKALAAERCGEWGRCAPSCRWEREALTSSGRRGPSGSPASPDRSSDPPRAPSSG